jgi:hypothetical protein
LISACITGYSWLAINFYNNAFIESNKLGGCLIKSITSIPCPSCGSTRAVLSFLKGDFSDSLFWNPIGIILIVIMVVTPIWILFDLVFKKSSLYNFYHHTELFLKRKWIVIISILLVLLNWIWNINKGL